MKCPSCAASYDDEFGFCPYCGTKRPKAQTSRGQVEETRWETCQVDLACKYGGLFSRNSYWLEATAVGPEGFYLVAKSAVFMDPTGVKPGLSAALSNLVKELSESGWEYSEGDIHSYRQQYRRRVRRTPN
jgi:hypothetical protein